MKGEINVVNILDGATFTQIINDLIINSDLNNSEFRVLAYAMSKPESWDFSAVEISKTLPICRETVQKTILSLIDKKYAKRILRQKIGSRSEYRYIFYNKPYDLITSKEIRHARAEKVDTHESEKPARTSRKSRHVPSRKSRHVPSRKSRHVPSRKSRHK